MLNSELACAKINLHLEVLNKRRDGYHNIFSLMISVDLCDLLQLEEITVDDSKKPLDVRIVTRGGKWAWIMETIPYNENLIVRAAKSYFAKGGVTGSVVIGVEKNIPSAAGLGGGSSDAAATLRLLNSQLQLFEKKELMQMASIIGSDVPYCLEGGIAICTGKGEVVEAIDGSLPYWVLILHTNIAINTREAYEALNRTSANEYSVSGIEKKANLMRDGVKKGDIEVFKHILKNDFEDYVFAEHQELKLFKDTMIDLGAQYAAMSGSGSAIFGIFKNYDVMREAEQYFLKRGVGVFCAHVM